MFKIFSKASSNSNTQDKEHQALIEGIKNDPSERPTAIFSSRYNPETQRMETSKVLYYGYTRYDEDLTSKFEGFGKKCLDKIESINTGSIDDRRAWSEYDQNTINQKLRETVKSVKTECSEYEKSNFDSAFVNPDELKQLNSLDDQRIVDGYDSHKRKLRGYLCLVRNDGEQSTDTSAGKPIWPGWFNSKSSYDKAESNRSDKESEDIGVMVCLSRRATSQPSLKSEHLDVLGSVARKYREYLVKRNQGSPTIANTREFLATYASEAEPLVITLSEGAAKIYPGLHPVDWERSTNR